MKTPLTALRLPLCAKALILVMIAASCSEQPSTVTLRMNYAPVGKVISYSLVSSRVGTMSENGEKKEDIDSKIEVEVIYTTQELLADSVAVVLEEDRWNWDKTDDSGQVKRVTKEYTFRLNVAPSGKILDSRTLSESSPAWDAYTRNYYEQGVPVFPERPVQIGHEWTQTSAVVLQDGTSEEAATTYKVKGLARRQGRNCAIIEYKGNMVLPIMLDPADSTQLQGVDRYEMTGIIYFSYDDGCPVISEEKRRVISDRSFIKKGSAINQHIEIDDVISYSLDKIQTL